MAKKDEKPNNEKPEAEKGGKDKGGEGSGLPDAQPQGGGGGNKPR